ncbi:MAG: hypothetical protein II842_14320 [Butyrivibrio sp.]|nr:hypothetical protein [Butyrivibrio sp.]
MKKVINFEPEYDELLKKTSDIISAAPDECFEKYYYLYEYTDELSVIKDSLQYPSMLNYVKTGLLTKEELIEALKR